MTLGKGRILRGSGASDAKLVSLDDLGGAGRPGVHGAPGVAFGRVAQRAVVEAKREASDRIARAEQAARTIVGEAEQTARALREQARAEGREEGAAALAAAWIKLRAEESARDERDLDRTVELARAMAERLVGEALTLAPGKIVSMCRQTLASARQARRAVVRAHPADAEALRAQASSLGLELAAVEIHADESRARGSLLLETDLGILDADLTIQLDRLARSLRDSLRS